MNEILLALLCMIVLWSVMWWIIKKRHGDNYKEILITYPFDSLRVGEVAIFMSGLSIIRVGDYVLINLPGYETIWKVVEAEGEKLKLVDRKGEVLVGFPRCHIWGKLEGYKGEVECY